MAPGKFEGCQDEVLGERLCTALNEGWAEDEIGDVAELGFYAIVELDGVKYIVAEDNFGFFSYWEYDSRDWDNIVANYEEFYQEVEEDEM